MPDNQPSSAATPSALLNGSETRPMLGAHRGGVAMATRAWRSDAPVPADDRRVERQMVDVTRATVRALGEQAMAATLTDLSIYGCRLATEATHAAGARLWLRFDGGWPIPSTVMWAEADQLGCRFDEPIANQLMRCLTQD